MITKRSGSQAPKQSRPGQRAVKHAPWERTGEKRPTEARRWAGSVTDQLFGPPEPASLEVAPGGQIPAPSPAAEDPRFGYGKGFSANDQAEIKRLRGELRRLKSISRRQLQLYEEMKKTEEERKRAEEEEETLRKDKQKGLPQLGALDWFKNVGKRAKGMILGFAKRKKKAEFKPGAFRG